MRDQLTTPRPDDTDALRGLRLTLSALRYNAERIEINARLRREVRGTPSSRDEFERWRRRDYDATKRAKETRRKAAAVIEQIKAAEERAALVATLIQ